MVGEFVKREDGGMSLVSDFSPSPACFSVTFGKKEGLIFYLEEGNMVMGLCGCGLGCTAQLL